MALKKSELYSSLWHSCDELRGGMDASQYKDYVLVLLFLKYISDKYAAITVPGFVTSAGERVGKNAGRNACKNAGENEGENEGENGGEKFGGVHETGRVCVR
jgi:type I restriction enzyme M protein